MRFEYLIFTFLNLILTIKLSQGAFCGGKVNLMRVLVLQFDYNF
jgi:hypothetical protein